jgi:hypothetical protein
MGIPLKVTMFLVQSDAGWSESFYTSQYNDVLSCLNGVLAPGNLVPTRVALLPAPVVGAGVRTSVARVRVNDVANPRSFIRSEAPFGFPGEGTFAGNGSVAETFSALILGLRYVLATTPPVSRYRQFLMRGLPEVVVNAPQTFNRNPAWVALLADFVNCLVGNPVGTGFQVRSRGPRGNPSRILTFAPQLSGTLAIVTPTPALGPPPVGWTGSYLIRGLKQPPGWAGIMPGTAPAPDGTIIVYSPRNRVRATGPTTALGQATIDYLVWQYPNLVGALPERIVERKVGRPFNLLRGRRSARS